MALNSSLHPVFVAIGGQFGNVGDTVLRRAYLDALRSVGELHVLAYIRNPEYLAGMGIRPEDTIYCAKAEWEKTMLRGARTTAWVWAFDAGEFRLWESGRSYLRLALLVLWARLNRGRAVQCGMGVWGPILHSLRNRRRVYGCVMALCNIVTWRDAVTRSAMGYGGVRPDWAFMLGQPTAWLCSERRAAGRELLAVSMRGDRQVPSASWLAAVRAQAARHELKIVVVAQVRIDQDRSSLLAEWLGGECVGWTNDDHVKREEDVRAIYRRSRYIVSDRLHALIIGMTEGALPVGYTVESNEKVERTMEAAGLRDVTFSQTSADLETALRKMADIDNRADELFGGLASARARLRRLVTDIHRLCGDEPEAVI